MAYKMIIGSEEFGDAYTELLPWLGDVDLDELAKCLIDDINGIRHMCLEIMHGGRDDFTSLTHTLTYLCRTSDFDMDLGSMDELKNAIGKVLKDLLPSLLRTGNFADVKYSVDFTEFTGRYKSIENITIGLVMHTEKDYGDKINLEIGKLANAILKTYVGDRRDRRPRRRNR